MNSYENSLLQDNVPPSSSVTLIPFEGNEPAYLSKLAELLEKPWNTSAENTGYLLSKKTTIKAITGESDDGSCWGFALWGSVPAMQYSPRQEYQRGNKRCRLQNCLFTVAHFDLFEQQASCACGCTRTITGLCLPESLCSLFVEINQTPPTDTRKNMCAIFINELASRLIEKRQPYLM